MSATATRSPWSSHSSKNRSHPRASTTPLAPPPRTPGSVGHNMTPLLSPTAPPNPVPSQSPRTPSPNYFGFIVDQSNDPPSSNPGQHTKRNWDFPSSTNRSNPILTPRTVPVEANPEFEAFRKKSESNQFNLGHGNLAQISRPSLVKHHSRHDSTHKVPSSGPLSPRSNAPIATREQSLDEDRMDVETDEGEPSFFDMPRRDSPANIASTINSGAPLNRVLHEHRHQRLSLPHSELKKSDQDMRTSSVQRAETLPTTVSATDTTMLTPQQCGELLGTLPDEILLLDLRVYPQYSQSRVRGALNLCIPTTLLKRSSFNLQKLEDTFTSDEDKERFATWEHCKYIIVYDANSTTLKDATCPVHVLKKFQAEGWRGTAAIIRGGFNDFSRKCPDRVDRRTHLKGADTAKQVLTIAPPGPGTAPVAGGCPMPTSKSAANPFFNTIRQNMDLIGGVGQMSIEFPANIAQPSENILPTWLRQAADPQDKGKLVSDRFLKIEKAEQRRMQEALSDKVSYGSSHTETPKKIQVAGIEKGSKNRYNNIFPYDHSRVKLQDVP